MGTRLIDSTPPASTRSSQPERTFWAPVLTASRPEAQKRLSCTPPTVSGIPAAMTAVRRCRRPGRRPGDAAEDDVADQVLVEVGKARTQFVDQADDEVERLDLIERAAALFAARRADGLVDEKLLRTWWVLFLSWICICSECVSGPTP